MFSVEYTARAVKQLKKMDRHTCALIIAWIEKNLVGCSDPRKTGKALKANHSGEWRYRIGDYRIIAQVSDQTITILILSIGHRKDIY